MSIVVTLKSIEDGECMGDIKPVIGKTYQRVFSKLGLDEYLESTKNYCENKGYEFVYRNRIEESFESRLYAKDSEGKEERYYISVESNYHELADAKDKSDSILFEMGQFVGDEQPEKKFHFEIDSIVTVSTKEARLFAQAILKLCDEIGD